MLEATMQKNDRKAKLLIWVFTIVVFTAVVLLGRYKLNVSPGFDVHIFAKMNAYINSAIAVLLVAALVAVKQKKYTLHKKLMLAALVLSIIFLLSYITHNLFSGEARYGDINHDGTVDPAELAAAGSMRMVYLIILTTHIILAAVILPFILFTAYRGLTAEYAAHTKLARYVWPFWLYVAVTGPLIYYMITPYYR